MAPLAHFLPSDVAGTLRTVPAPFLQVSPTRLLQLPSPQNTEQALHLLHCNYLGIPESLEPFLLPVATWFIWFFCGNSFLSSDFQHSYLRNQSEILSDLASSNSRSRPGRAGSICSCASLPTVGCAVRGAPGASPAPAAGAALRPVLCPA